MNKNKFDNHDIRDFILKEDKSKDYFESVIQKLGKEKQLILFGAGVGGKRTFEFMKRYGLEDRIVCFADNNSRKWGTNFCGILVLRMEEAKQEYPDGLVVISCGEGDAIKEQCIRNGICPERIYIPDLTQVDEEGKDDRKSAFRFIWDNMDGFAGCYSILGDEKSKHVLTNIINYRISHKAELLKEVYDTFESQYFDEELIHITGKETFLDCGAYTGDTLERLLEFSDFKEGEIHCFETDEGNYKILQRNTERFSSNRIICHKMAVWNKQCVLKFNAVGSGSGFVSGAPSWRGGVYDVEAGSIDNLFMDAKVDFIKMDIEGAEIRALLGATETIMKQKPVLAISAYHSLEHLYQIPLLIKGLNPYYKVYLRHYRELSANETVCYAI